MECEFLAHSGKLQEAPTIDQAKSGLKDILILL